MSEKEKASSEKSSECVEQKWEEDWTEGKDGLESDGVPYDRGWAWVVVFGCFIEYFLYAGYLKCASLFYVELVNRFNAQATEAALFFTMRAAVLSLGSLFIMNIIVHHLGERKTVLIGGFVLSLSGILPSLFDDLMPIIFLQGMLLGLGQSMLVSPGEVLMGAYFKERRALAMPVAKCGASVGSILMPQLITFFLQTYGLSGALLLTGAICLQSLPAGLLLRPVSYFKTRRNSKLAPGARTVKHEMINGNEEVTEKLIRDDRQSNDGSLKRSAQNCTVKSEKSPLESICIDRSPQDSPFWLGLKAGSCETVATSALQDRKNASTTSASLASSLPNIHVSRQSKINHQKRNGLFSGSLEENEKTDTLSAEQEWSKTLRILQGAMSDSISNEALFLRQSAEDIHGSGIICKEHDHQAGVRPGNMAGQSEKPQSSPKKERSTKRPKASRFLLDFSLFRSPLFRLLLAFFVLFPSVNIMSSYLPAIASENGVTDSQNGVLLSAMGGLDLFCRIMCAVIANSKVVRVPTMIIIAYVILGVTAQFVRFLTSFYHFLALAILQGSLGSVANCMLPVLVLEFVGLENMAKGLGFVLLTCGGVSAAAFPLLGYLRDITGSYVVVYHVLGVGAVLGAGFLCCENCVRRLENNRRKFREIELGQ